MASLSSICAAAALAALVTGPTQGFAALTDHASTVVDSPTASLSKYAFDAEEHGDFGDDAGVFFTFGGVEWEYTRQGDF